MHLQDDRNYMGGNKKGRGKIGPTFLVRWRSARI